jgi:ABC-type transporter Mla MlaB component
MCGAVRPVATPNAPGSFMSDAKTPVNTVMLSGPMTLYESVEVRDQLRSALEAGHPLRLNLETSGPWDLSGLQLLASTVASARQSGLDVRFENVPRVCAEVAERSGLRDWLAGLTDSFL